MSKNILITFLLCSLIIAAVQCKKDEDKLFSDAFYSKKDISYGGHPQQKYDIYLPALRDKENTRTLILIHGGGWTSGERWEMDVFIDTAMMKRENIAIVNFGYRLATETQFKHPFQMEDISKFIQHLKENADKYQINPHRIALLGASAGGHLSMLYDYGYDTNDDIRLVVNCVGPSNFVFEELLQDTSQYLGIYGYLGKTHWDDINLWYSASPIHRATKQSAPTLLFYGEKDDIVPPIQGVWMKSKLDELNIPNQLTVYSGAGHGWWEYAPYFDDTKAKIEEWIKLYL